ncbi:interaptin-like [Sitophilus oryzae]|uniref:Interaptin-like n=1 Tax=Sitophilus oryzae TaxID=7048 RepID=A0A6J2YSA7_SITOR|nr:interaptin-like [Sitophilus oryzae]
MDFGLDNEFDSDDSFFDEPKLAIKKASPAKTNPKKSLEDIFGFQEEKSNEKSNLDTPGNIASSPGPKPKVRFNVEENASEDVQKGSSKTSVTSKGLDWLGSSDSLDFSKKEPKSSSKGDILDDILPSAPQKSETKKPLDLLDDILPKTTQKSDSKKAISFEDILKDSKAQKTGSGSLERSNFDLTQSKSGTGSLENILGDKGPGNFDKIPQRNALSASLDLEKTGMASRRGRRASNTGVSDILGLFGSEQSPEPISRSRKPNLDAFATREGRKNTGEDVPDWLGGSTTSATRSDTTIQSQTPEITREDQQKVQKNVDIKDSTETKTNADDSFRRNIEKNTDNTVQTSENFQTNISNLQTQESFLLVSLQLKQYEQSLTDIKQQQEQILKKQENQFDLFLNKYIEKQKNIEQEMLAQQERINQNIRTLALGGIDAGRRNFKESGYASDDIEDPDDANDKVVSKIVENMKQRHQEEFFLMEESYKKQITMLEKSSELVEQRLQKETEVITKIYEDKLANMKVQHAEELDHWTEKLKSLEQKHRDELEAAREDYSRFLREAKQDFLDQIERFKEQKHREMDLMADGVEISQRITKSADKLDQNGVILEKLQEKVISDYDVLSVVRERSIENKEREVATMRLSLEKCREQAEKDRSQLLALVRTLEQKISEQDHNAQEERWAMQQAAATLAARAVAFDREVEFSRTSIEREREQLKTLKESILAEQARVTAQLTEEKLRIDSEQTRLKVSASLVTDYEVQKVKNEAETAIQVAKELTEQLTRERNLVQRQKVDLENFRRRLVEKEVELTEREEEMEEVRREMRQKIVEDRRISQEARVLEARYKEKLSELQEQTLSLSGREKKLAEEKIQISKERLALYTSIKEKANTKKCVLCKTEDEDHSKNELFYVTHPASDTEILRLKMEAMDDERNSEVSREDNSPNILPSS